MWSPKDRPPAWSRLGNAAVGALLGGLLGGFVVVGVTLVLKAGIDFAGRQGVGFAIVVPVLGLALAALDLQGIGRSAARAVGRAAPWRTFPPDVIRSDISGDVVETAGQEERFPWRLAPIRALAILATVGSGAAMGTEAPAAYLGVATGVALADRGKRWRRLLRSAGLAGGAAGVAALMGIALVGTAFMLEIGRRRRAALDGERVLAALIGGVIGWEIDRLFGLSLIRLVVPKVPPDTLAHAAITVLAIGTLSGGISALAGLAVYRAKSWSAPPAVRLVIGAGILIATTLLLARIAAPSAAVGPGGGAIVWAENTNALPLSLLAVCLLRAAATTATAAAGGCGGVFIPFLAVGDLAGRVFAPLFGVGSDMAGAAGAAGGIAGGYRLPFTAVAMIFGVGGPPRAMLTSLATVAVAFVAAGLAEAALDKLLALRPQRKQAPVS
ncbi:MAG TPA: chloride channel protein [Polyangia bacterium]|nr:chloride channel protein [Polyangia bacterium]